MTDDYIGRKPFYGIEHEEDLLDDPVEQFGVWYRQAEETDEIEANAMSISTVGSDGYPRSRMVLMKKFNEQGMVFFTNYQSQKAQDIENNDRVALLFWWEEQYRQVRILGKASKLTRVQSQDYFSTRDFDSQLHAILSPQSENIESLDALKMTINEFKAKKLNQELCCPEHWGGYMIEYRNFEFWQGGKDRLHRRISYAQKGDRWTKQILAP